MVLIVGDFQVARSCLASTSARNPLFGRELRFANLFDMSFNFVSPMIDSRNGPPGADHKEEDWRERIRSKDTGEAVRTGGG